MKWNEMKFVQIIFLKERKIVCLLNVCYNLKILLTFDMNFFSLLENGCF